MKLTELDPHWLSPDFFIFKAPTTFRPSGKPDWLTCKRVVMGHKEQRILVQGNDDPQDGCVFETRWTKESIVLCKDDCAWDFPANADFNTITVMPSLDASKSGNWHGFIRGGEVT